MATLEEVNVQGMATHYAHTIVCEIADKMDAVMGMDMPDREKLAGFALVILTAEQVLREKVEKLRDEFLRVQEEVAALGQIVDTLPEED